MLRNVKANRLQLLAGEQQIEKCKPDEWLPAAAAKQLIEEISCSGQKNETKSLLPTRSCTAQIRRSLTLVGADDAVPRCATHVEDAVDGAGTGGAPKMITTTW